MKISMRHPEPGLWFAEVDGVSVGFTRDKKHPHQLFITINTEDADQDNYADGTPSIWIGLNDSEIYDGEHYREDIADDPEPETRQILRDQGGECERLGRHFFKRDFILGVFPTRAPYCMWCGKVTSKEES